MSRTAALPVVAAAAMFALAAAPAFAQTRSSGPISDPSATQPTAGSASRTRSMKPLANSRPVAPVTVTRARPSTIPPDSPEMRARVAAIYHGETSTTEAAGTDSPSVLGADAAGGRLKSGPTGPR